MSKLEFTLTLTNAGLLAQTHLAMFFTVLTSGKMKEWTWVLVIASTIASVCRILQIQVN
jgi:hypothetical protein